MNREGIGGQYLETTRVESFMTAHVSESAASLEHSAVSFSILCIIECAFGSVANLRTR